MSALPAVAQGQRQRPRLEHTHVSAGNIVTLESGTDTTLKGAVVSGEKVVAIAGTSSGYGNLVIESLQDQSTYDSKQQSAGVSVSVGMGTAAA